MISPGSLLVTGVVAAIIFGTKRLRHMGEDLGVALRNFRKGLQGESLDEETKAPTASSSVTENTDKF